MVAGEQRYSLRGWIGFNVRFLGFYWGTLVIIFTFGLVWFPTWKGMQTNCA